MCVYEYLNLLIWCCGGCGMGMGWGGNEGGGGIKGAGTPDGMPLPPKATLGLTAAWAPDCILAIFCY